MNQVIGHSMRLDRCIFCVKLSVSETSYTTFPWPTAVWAIFLVRTLIDSIPKMSYCLFTFYSSSGYCSAMNSAEYLISRRHSLKGRPANFAAIGVSCSRERPASRHNVTSAWLIRVWRRVASCAEQVQQKVATFCFRHTKRIADLSHNFI